MDAFWSSTSTNDDYHLNTASNHDYFVAKRGFFWDLSPWADEAPIDDPTQPLGTDLTTLQAILLAAYVHRRMYTALVPALCLLFVRDDVFRHEPAPLSTGTTSVTDPARP